MRGPRLRSTPQTRRSRRLPAQQGDYVGAAMAQGRHLAHDPADVDDSIALPGRSVAGAPGTDVFECKVIQASAPEQLEPAPAVHPKQCAPVAIRAPANSRTSSRSKTVSARPPASTIGIESIWLKSQS